MTLFPIDQVRGTHLRAEQSPQIVSHDLDILVPSDIVSRHTLRPQSLTLKMFNERPVYIVTSEDQTQVFDAKTGAIWETLNEALATQIAVSNYAGRSTQTTATFFQDKAPREYGREGPVWRVDFKKPDAAWSNRENFNSWWIKTVACLAVFFFLTGFALVVLRLRSAFRRRRETKSGA